MRAILLLFDNNGNEIIFYFAINQMHHDYHSEHVICVCNELLSLSLSFSFQKLKKKRDVSKKFFFLLYNICDLFSEIVSIETNLYNN